MADVFKSYKEQSRVNWGTTIPEAQQLNTEQITLGAVLRIADAVEKMALNHAQLVRERDDFEMRYKGAACRELQLSRRLSAAKGRITKLKKQLKG